MGEPRHTWEFTNPMTLPIIPTDVWGAKPTIKCPIKSSIESIL
jgi:hypothetical protein